MRHKKTAQITFRIDVNLKEAAEKAAAQERRSLTSLIEKVLAKHLRNRRHLSNRGRPPTEAARTALKLAAREIEVTNRYPLKSGKAGNGSLFEGLRNSATFVAIR